MTKTTNTRADSLVIGDRIIHRNLEVTVVGGQEPSPNQFGLPWFRYKIEADDGRWGYAIFGPTGHAAKVDS